MADKILCFAILVSFVILAAGSRSPDVTAAPLLRDSAAWGNECAYTLYVETGSIWKAGTDAVIGVALAAADGSGFAIRDLEPWGGLMGAGHDYYERGNVDAFSGRGPCLPSLPCRMNLTSDGSGPHATLNLVGAWSATSTITNNCGYTVWPGLLSGAGSAPLPTTGFALTPQAVAAAVGWSGRMWARTLCTAADGATRTGWFACTTGDCGSGDLQCNGGGAPPLATLAEFTLNGSGGLDFFGVSLVDGNNLPVLVTPLSSSSSSDSGKCAATGCVAELNGACPADLWVAPAGEGLVVACRSACDAFGVPQYCCSGAYGNPSTCQL